MAFQSFEKKIIEPIIKKIKLPKGRFFFSPGNHDIKRDDDEEFVESGLKETLNSPEAVNKFIDSKKEIGIRRIKPFKNFEKFFFKNYNDCYNLTNLQSCFEVKINDLNIGITCFNSAWRCYDSITDKGKLLLGERQVINARTFMKNCDLRIAVIHHPLDYLSDFDYRSVKSFIEKDYDMIFIGHYHEGSSWTRSDMYGKLFISVAPSNWTLNLRNNNRINANGYTIVDYDIDLKRIKTYSRRYSHKKECFDPNTDLGDENGTVVFRLPTSEDLGKYDIEIQITEKIKKTHFEKINEHLLSYNTDTKAPKKFERIFVFPRIENKIEYDIEKQNEVKVFNLDELCSADDNILVFGTKESGKTVLLDRILIEFTKNIRKYHKTGIYFDFGEVDNKRFETIINSFIGIGIRKIKNYLNEHKVVLLIDNIEFNKQASRNLKRLEEFIHQYKNVRIIATSPQLIEDEIPMDFYDYHIFSHFKIVFLKSFRSKHIKELMQKWFLENRDYDSRDKINKLLNFFCTLNLPWTPMAISLFLWIIEQQEHYKPINNATMLENFIERLFKKWSENEIYSDIFDYRNKERLLADIAHHMYIINRVNYRLTYIELLDFIKNYLNRKKFDFLSEELLNHFLSKGIFIREIDESEIFIRFRFNCFFQFFLMKKMDFNPKFKAYVLEEDNFLKFSNEIDYFTGIKRDKSDILKTLIDRMDSEFKEILDFFKSNFDDVFNIKASISSKLKHGKFIKGLRNIDKPNSKDYDRIIDGILDGMTPTKDIQKKKYNSNPLLKLEKLLYLSAIVLKNTEEVEEENLKDYSYKKILFCSMGFSCLIYFYFEEMLKAIENEENQYFITLLKESKKYLPLCVEIILNSLMGTGKLSVVIRDKVKEDLNSTETSDFEKFISVFLYSDIKGKGYLNYIKKFTRKIKKQYIYDLSLIKIIAYYFIRSKDKKTDLEYEKIISEIITHSRGLRKNEKTEIMSDFRERKKRYKINYKPFDIIQGGYNFRS